MITELQFLMSFVVENLVRIWPYLLITIPVAVAVQLSGASKYIRRALTAKPMVAIILATAVGAFSPFCSCTVIPIVAALLIGGVPLAPVMSFWIASPSMDPEIFFLSVATIGWELAVWRLAATLVLSLTAGYITQIAMTRHWLGGQILRERAPARPKPIFGMTDRIQAGWQNMVVWVRRLFQPKSVVATASGLTSSVDFADSAQLINEGTAVTNESSCSDNGSCSVAATDDASTCDAGCAAEPVSFWSKLGKETWAATTLVIRFVLLAFVLEALIIRYIPTEWITSLLGQQNPFAILFAAILGVPVYTSNLAALPMVGGLLVQGMNPAAGLAFLIAGPTTTLPAMAAVWQLASRRVFALYVAFSLIGAVLAGYVYQFFS